MAAPTWPLFLETLLAIHVGAPPAAQGAVAGAGGGAGRRPRRATGGVPQQLRRPASPPAADAEPGDGHRRAPVASNSVAVGGGGDNPFQATLFPFPPPCLSTTILGSSNFICESKTEKYSQTAHVAFKCFFGRSAKMHTRAEFDFFAGAFIT